MKISPDGFPLIDLVILLGLLAVMTIPACTRFNQSAFGPDHALYESWIHTYRSSLTYGEWKSLRAQGLIQPLSVQSH